MDNRKWLMVLAGLLVLAMAAFGYTLTRGYGDKKEEVRTEVAEKGEKADETACASSATYARLKEVAFEEAVRLRNADPANLDTLAATSVVRMENPVVMSRDRELNVTVCSGRFILELPPGAEAAFGGQRRLAANIEYAAQAAADGSGLVYEIRGAEPIIQKLAAFNLRGPKFQPQVAAPADESELAEAPVAPAAPSPAVEADPSASEPALPPVRRPPPAAPVRPQPKAQLPVEARAAPKPAPRAAEPAPVRSAASARPSFNCRYARSRSEQMVCSDGRLAAKDRAMSSLFYSALADADPRTRAQLRRTRDRFLAYRERCGSEACVAEAYDGRMDEIRDIMAEAE